jgi:hypothetical protein
MKTIVVMPGGFHPFHAGHYALYKSAVEAFPGADVYVAATNDQKERPFPFVIKEKLAQIAGVAKGHFIQVTSPFKAQEITSHYNPNQDVLIFVRSEKDRNEQPKPGGMKKDGTPAYFQPYTGKNLQPFSKHAYMAYLPTVEFGPGITSATQIRTAWPTLNSTRKNAMVMSLYPAAKQNPQLTASIVEMMDLGMGGASGLTESVLNEAAGYETVDRLVKKLNIDLSGNQYGPLKTKGPGMRVWTRGAGSRYRDPGMILIDQNMTSAAIHKWNAEKPMEQFWKILTTLGAKSLGNVTHRNSANPRPAVTLGGLLFVNYGEVIDWGSVSRLKQMRVMAPEVTEEFTTNLTTESEQDPQLSKPIKPFNQVKQIPLDALL